MKKNEKEEKLLTAEDYRRMAQEHSKAAKEIEDCFFR